MTTKTAAPAVPTPTLKYRLSGADDPSRIVRCDGPPLFAAFRATASVSHCGALRFYVEGPMRKRDGGRGQHNRSCIVDTSAEQPEWLSALIADAADRLGVAR